MKVAHIRRGELLRQYPNEQGRVVCENGDIASPPQVGYVNGDDRVVPVEEVTNDFSTGPNIVKSRTVSVEKDRVLIEITVRDRTPEEAASRDGAKAERTLSSIKTAILYAAERAGDDITRDAVRRDAFKRAKEIYTSLTS